MSHLTPATSTPDTYFYAFDGNGNVRALVKADAANPSLSAMVEKYAYDGFGREIIAPPSISRLNSFAFSTKYWDAETGMNYYGYRYYASGDGRWINRDPIKEKGGWNVYAMAGNDIIKSIDILGLASIYGFRDVGEADAADNGDYTFTMYLKVWYGKELIISKPGNISKHTAPGIAATDFLHHFNANCRCIGGDKVKSEFIFAIATKSFLLPLSANVWSDANIRGSIDDPNVSTNWLNSSIQERRGLVSRHEKQHRDDTKDDYDIAVGELKSAEKEYEKSDVKVCLEEADAALKKAVYNFTKNQAESGKKVEAGDY